MKFTKEDVLEDIKKGFTGANGNTALKLSDRTVTETIEALMAFVGEDAEREDIVAKIKPVIDTANRNLIKEQSDFVKDYKPATPPPSPPKPPATPNPPAFNMEEFMQILADQNKKTLEDALNPLKQELDGIKTEKAKQALHSEVRSMFEAKKPDPERKKFADEAWEIIVSSAKDVNSATELFSAYDKQYNKLCSLVGADGYIPVGDNGEPVPPKSSFEKAVDKVKSAQDGASNAQAIKVRLGLATEEPKK